MNRKKKIYQKVKKKLLQAKAKKQPAKKSSYISKAQRALLEEKVEPEAEKRSDSPNAESSN
ncbi:DUF2986 domain-containing protein [Thiomicrospira sp. R3]|uniref:DUF2986 domain-containing protein n=1 Tax=Thiomicrospira sp. R3 TaxID=3035472 RepID=UPI00259BB370|nr:DUF2986 domain-containing protein [Thiomicrospira sp. R3]WFE68223.1 DUF2986 domain-containing protein [Thiomicrospira sp. R3]